MPRRGYRKIGREAFRARALQLHREQDGRWYSRAWLAEQFGVDPKTLDSYVEEYDADWMPWLNQPASELAEQLDPAEVTVDAKRRVISVSDGFLTRFGYRREDLVGRTLAESMRHEAPMADDHPIMRSVVRPAQEGQLPPPFVTWVYHADGHRMAVRVEMLQQGGGGLRGRLTPISDDAGITGEPATTDLLATVLTCSIDGKTGNYLAVNVPFCRFWGYTPGDLVGTSSLIQLRHHGVQDSPAEVAAIFNGLRAAGKTASASYRSYGWTSSGERREYEGVTTYVASYDRWDCVLYVASQAETAPSPPAYLSFHVNETGRLVSISDYTCQVLGVRREDVINRPAADVLTPGQPVDEAWNQLCQRAKAEPGKVFERDTITVTMATPRGRRRLDVLGGSVWWSIQSQSWVFDVKLSGAEGRGIGANDHVG
jgi:PAS domain S-box-containing protein